MPQELVTTCLADSMAVSGSSCTPTPAFPLQVQFVDSMEKVSICPILQDGETCAKIFYYQTPYLVNAWNVKESDRPITCSQPPFFTWAIKNVHFCGLPLKCLLAEKGLLGSHNLSGNWLDWGPQLTDELRWWRTPCIKPLEGLLKCKYYLEGMK